MATQAQVANKQAAKSTKQAAAKQAPKQSKAAAAKQAPAKKAAPAARAELRVVNGVKEPTPGSSGKCRAVWDACDAYLKKYHTAPTAADMKVWSEESGANANNTMIEMYRWKKFSAADIAAAEKHAKAAAKH